MPETITSSRWLFDCPACGVKFDSREHPEGLTMTLDTDLHEKVEMEEAWPGGPLLTVPSVMREYAPGDRWLSTSACDDRFNLTRDWDMHIIQYGAGTPDDTSRLMVTAKQVVPA